MFVFAVLKYPDAQPMKLVERIGIRQLFQRRFQPIVIPRLLGPAFLMEKFPQIVAVFLIIPGNAPEIGELIGQIQLGHRQIGAFLQSGNGFFFPYQPGVFGGKIRAFIFAHSPHQKGNTAAEFRFQGLGGHIGILHHVVEYRGGQHLLLLGHGGGDGSRFGAVQNIWCMTVTPHGPGMGFHGKENGPIQ